MLVLVRKEQRKVAPMTENRSSQQQQQVLFMDGDEVDPLTGSNHSMTNHTATYYQVATPKSPHELSSLADNEDDPAQDAERLKFVKAKKDILDQLNLQIMLTHKEMEHLIEENEQVSGQLEVLKILHGDSKLSEKVEAFQEKRAKEVEESIRSGLSRQGSRQSQDATGSGYYYHTRSKSGSNVSGLRLANDNVIDIRMRGAKTLPQQSDTSVSTGHSTPGVTPPGSAGSVQPGVISKIPYHNHQRNFSSTCATSNSGVVGTTEGGQPIFRRPDGVLIIITCSVCKREGFTSAQGIVNHMRLKHFLHYQSQPLAVLSNQVLLPDDKQDPEILAKFKEKNKSPTDSYLSSTVPLPNNEKRQHGKETVSSVSTGFESANGSAQASTASSSSQTLHHSTAHLQKLYPKDDFKEIINYVKEAKTDLETIMKCEDEEAAAAAAAGAGAASEEESKPRKRSLANERARPAEKKARPDVIHVTENHIPDEDKRSRHYNLRAKSKLRSHNRDD